MMRYDMKNNDCVRRWNSCFHWLSFTIVFGDTQLFLLSVRDSEVLSANVVIQL